MLSILIFCGVFSLAKHVVFYHVSWQCNDALIMMSCDIHMRDL